MSDTGTSTGDGGAGARPTGARPAGAGSPLGGRVALVTGASSGIGRAIALELGRQGAAVCVNYHSGGDRAKAVVDEIGGMGGRAFAFGADVANASEVARMVAAIVEQYGHLDVCVNNAGLEIEAPFLEATEKDWDTVMSVNLKGPFICSQAAARQMVAQGRGGRIVNISSVHEDLPFPGYASYAASKGGMRMLTRTIALELAEHGIGVVGVGPGAIATPMNERTLDDPARTAALDRLVPLGRVGRPEEVAALVAWLASGAASYVTATTFFIDGGLMHTATSL